MKLLPLDSPERIHLVASWLAQKENYQWLDFGDGRQLVSPEWLTIATQRATHVFRLFTSDVDDAPIGVVGPSSVNRHFTTATLRRRLGDKSYAGRGYASRATSQMLPLGFVELGLRAINPRTVEPNPS